MKGYCFKCRRKVKMENPELVTLRSGQTMTKGTCAACGLKVLRCNGKTTEKQRKNNGKTMTNAHQEYDKEAGFW